MKLELQDRNIRPPSLEKTKTDQSDRILIAHKRNQADQRVSATVAPVRVEHGESVKGQGGSHLGCRQAIGVRSSVTLENLFVDQF